MPITKRSNKLNKFLEYILALYIALVVYMSIWLTLRFLWIIPIFFISALLVIRFLENACLRFITSSKIQNKSSFSMKQTLLVFLLIFLGQLLYWFAYYPGGFNLDAYGQWDQVHGLMQLNNWHPILTTAFYWLLTRIVDSLAFCIFVQISIFSVTIAFLIKELSHHPVPDWFLWFIASCIAINPAICMNNVCLIKDVPFAILICWIVWCSMRMERLDYDSSFIQKSNEESIHREKPNGTWLASWINTIVLCILLIMLSLVRHNAVFFTIPYLFVLGIVYRKRITRILAITIFSFGIVAFIQGPVFSAFQIHQHSNVTGEAVGIPMAAMANAFINDPEHCPPETSEFLLTIADEKAWREHYITGEWDSCKWEFGGTELLEDTDIKEIVRLFLKTLVACPDTVYESISENTRVVWQVVGFTEWTAWVYIEENDYGIIEHYNPFCNKLVNGLKQASESFVGGFFSWELGPAILVIFFCLLILEKCKCMQHSSFIIAILFYDFLTMYLLCGPSFRYFYFSQILVLPVVAYTFTCTSS